VIPYDRCPQCAALIRPEQAWCSLCHADLRPPPEPGIEAERVADVAAPGSGTGADFGWDSGADADPVPPELAPGSAFHEPMFEEPGFAVASHVSTNGSGPSGRHGRHSRAVEPAGTSHGTVDPRSAAVAVDFDAHSPAAADPDLVLAGLDVDGMLRRLQSDQDKQLLGLVGRLETKSTKVMVITAATVVVTGVAIGVMFILGTVLH
jgi:hypothetical protein